MPPGQKMLESLASRLPLQDSATCPENQQEKQVHLCEVLGGQAEHDSMHKAVDNIPGGEEELTTHLGPKTCCSHKRTQPIS
jgi:hypothetical protein